MMFLPKSKYSVGYVSSSLRFVDDVMNACGPEPKQKHPKKVLLFWNHFDFASNAVQLS